MNSQRATIEIIAPTINEAIEKGLADLELTREEVDIEILDEGSRGYSVSGLIRPGFDLL
jgi:spoIIIJ-associated protein